MDKDCAPGRRGRSLARVTVLAGAAIGLASSTIGLALRNWSPVESGSRAGANLDEPSEHRVDAASGSRTTLVLKPPSASAMDRWPLQFEPNESLADPNVTFVARGSGYGLFLSNDAAELHLRNDRAAASHSTGSRSPERQSAGARSALLRMQLVGGNPRPRVHALDRSPGTANYFLGNDRREWRTKVQTFGRVEYSEVWAGIDLAYYGNQRQLEYDFRVAPGADPRRIRLRFKGATELRVDGRGDLVLQTRAGEVRLHAPNVYQEGDGGKRAVTAGFVIAAHRDVGFRIGEYDRGEPLIIDPTLVYSATFGGDDNDDANGVAIDGSGNAYVVGTTFSLNFPVVGGVQSTLKGGLDVVVTKVSPTGALVYSTYLGGSGDDLGRAIAVDSAGAAYVTGSTRSTNFPTMNPVQAANAGGFTDVFVTKISPSGSALEYSTYVGGTDQESGGGIAVDSTGAAYVTGYTQSSTFPATAGAFLTALASGTCFVGRPCADAFVFKLNPAGSAFVYSTFLGGNGNDNLDFLGNPFGAIAVDSSGNAYVTGVTNSLDFPTVNPFQAACNACSSYSTDAFVTKLNATGTALVFSSYLGGSSDEVGRGIAVDAGGDAFVTGSTVSLDFPTTPGAFQRSFQGGLDAFVTKVATNGSSLVYSTYLGGRTGDDIANGIAVDATGNAYVTGTTGSADFPTANPLQARGGGGLFMSTDAAASWSVINAGLPAQNNALVIDSIDPNIIYVANTSGVAKSTDGGTSWHPTAFRSSAFSLRLDPGNSHVIFAGMANGVAKSTDSGDTWTTSTADLTGVGAVIGLEIDPTNASVVYAGTTNGGVRKSTNGGAGWSPMNNGITDMSIYTLVMDATAPMTLYAGNSKGVNKTTDGGATWNITSTGLPTGSGRSVTSFAFDPTMTSTLYATTAASFWTEGGVFKSTNGGGSWTPLVQTEFSLGSIVVDPSNPNTIYVASNAPTSLFALSNPSSGVGLLKSSDGGATWISVGLTQDLVEALVLDPTHPSTIFAPTNGGYDAFLAVFNASGSSLRFGTLFGGTGAEQGNAVAVGGTGPTTSVFLAGATASRDFPGTPSPSITPTPRVEEASIPQRQPDDEFLTALQGTFGCPDVTLTHTRSDGSDSLPNGSEGSFYNGSLSASDGRTYHWSVSGDLPPGLKLSTTTGPFATISGEPSTPGTYTFVITADDGNGCVYSQDFAMTIAKRPALLGQNDGAKGDPISTATGELYDFFDQDLYLRGPLPLSFSRYYSTGLRASGLISSALGDNWMHNYDLRLDLNGTTAEVIYEMGQPVIFESSGGVWSLSTTESLVYQLVQQGALFRFYDPASSLIYTFDSSAGGHLAKIEDRSGNALSLTYGGGVLTKVADGLGRTLTFTYSGGKLANVKDQSGRSVSFAHTGNSLTGSTDAAGHTTTYAYTTVGSRQGLLVSSSLPRANVPFTQTYDVAARVATQTDGTGGVSHLAYDTPSAGSTTVTDALAGTWVFRYQNVRNLIEQKDEAGNSLLLGYDDRFRRTSITGRAGGTTTYAYHAGSGMLASITYADGSTVTFTYAASTANGLTFYDLVSVVYPDGTEERFTHDAKGRVISETDRAGQVWLFTYNSRGQVLTATLSTGGVVTVTYNADGTMASLQMPNATATTFTYDALARPLTRQQAGGNPRNYQWDALDQVSSLTDERGATSSVSYDANGLLSTATDPAGGTVAFAYNAADLLAGTTDQAGQATTVSYDALQRVSSLTFPDGRHETFGYDVTGNVTSITDGEGKVWRIAYDADGRETSFTTPLGRVTSVQRDTLGQVSGLTTPLGNHVALGHDHYGRLTTVTDPLSHVMSWGYDANGNIASFTLANGIAASYTRNGLANITRVIDGLGKHWDRSYDAAGRLLSTTDPLGHALSYSRDGRGRISGVTFPGGSRVATTTDGAGLLTRSAFSDGTTLAYSYDARGLLASATGITLQRDIRGDITSSNGIAVDRDVMGRISTLTFAPGKAVTYSYDRRDLVTQIQDFVGGATALAYDDDGRLLTITRPNGTVTSYTYDADGNVASIGEHSGATTLASTTLTRNASGLVTQATRSVPLQPTVAQLQSLAGSHSFDGASQIVGFGYDKSGRRTADDLRTYSWDATSRLKGYAEAGQIIDLTYDAFDLMLSESDGAGARQYLWNYALALPSVSVVRQRGSDLRYYVHTPDGELLYWINAADSSRHYFHFDEMGNTLFLTGDAGAVTDSYAYAPYGTLLASTGSTDNPFTFAGRYGLKRIGTRGLYYARQRFYDSVNACFISRDSLSRIEPRLVNPYQYGAANPLLFYDATGGEPASPVMTATTATLDTATGAAGVAGSIEQGYIGSQGIWKIPGTGITPGLGVGKTADALEAEAKFVFNMTERLPTDKSIDYAAKIGPGFKSLKKASEVRKLPFEKLKTLGKLGKAAQVVEIGISTYNLYNGIQRVHQEASNERDRILLTYRVQSHEIIQLKKQQKINKIQMNRLLLNAEFDMQEQLLRSGAQEDFTVLLHAFEHTKRSFETFVPLPLNAIPNPFENKPLIDFGM